MNILRSQSSCLWYAVGLRAALLFYSLVHDALFEVSFTDIDYHVFSDGAALVAAGRSPFERPTYRYTPLLAMLLVPNVWFPMFGKILFSTCDVLCGLLLSSILRHQGHPAHIAQRAAAIWWLNGLTAIIATRGSCDALLVLVVLGALSLLLHQRPSLAALCLGLAIHIRIYPIIYLPIFSLFAADQSNHQKTSIQEEQPPQRQSPPPPPPPPNPSRQYLPGTPASSLRHRSSPNKAPIYTSSPAPTGASLLAQLRTCLLLGLTPTSLQFIMLTLTTCGVLFFAMSVVGGPAYITEGLLHHTLRADQRHNYSVYFYPFYLLSRTHAGLAGMVGFLPQAALVGASALLWRHPAAAMLVATLVFVAFNKVCTAQYFVWFLSLVPLILPSLQHDPSPSTYATPSPRNPLSALLYRVRVASPATRAAGWWLAAQGLWLALAYTLEHQGVAVFLPLWGASLLLLVASTRLALALLHALV